MKRRFLIWCLSGVWWVSANLLLGCADTAYTFYHKTICQCDPITPYIYTPLTNGLTVAKPQDTILKTGQVGVCMSYAEPDQKDIDLAIKACGFYQLTPLKIGLAPIFSCSTVAPYEMVYQCVNPNMRLASGHYINPLDDKEVKEWKAQQDRIKKYQNTLPPKPSVSAPTSSDHSAQ